MAYSKCMTLKESLQMLPLKFNIRLKTEQKGIFHLYWSIIRYDFFLCSAAGLGCCGHTYTIFCRACFSKYFIGYYKPYSFFFLYCAIAQSENLFLQCRPRWDRECYADVHFLAIIRASTKYKSVEVDMGGTREVHWHKLFSSLLVRAFELRGAISIRVPIHLFVRA